MFQDSLTITPENSNQFHKDLMTYLLEKWEEENGDGSKPIKKFVKFAQDLLNNNKPTNINYTMPGLGVSFADGTLVAFCRCPNETENPAMYGFVPVHGNANLAPSIQPSHSVKI